MHPTPEGEQLNIANVVACRARAKLEVSSIAFVDFVLLVPTGKISLIKSLVSVNGLSLKLKTSVADTGVLRSRGNCVTVTADLVPGITR